MSSGQGGLRAGNEKVRNMASRAISPATEWQENWPMVVAAMAGFSLSTISTHSMGLFMDPLSEEFGWSRAQISSGLSIYAVLSVPLALLAGAMIDRWGSRPIAIAGIILFSLAFASLGLADGSMSLWWAQWAMFSLCALGVHTAVWTTAVSSRFSSGRGLALAVTLCGSSVTQIVAPITANALIDDLGWRQAYFWLGLGWGTIALVLALFFFRDARNLGPRHPAVAPPTMGGLTLKQALRNVRIWRIAGTELLTSMLVMSIIVHFVPILTSGGVERSTAAAIAGSVGFAAICGKLFTGWLLDRAQSSWIPTVSLWLPAVACLLLLDPGWFSGAAVVAAALFGYAVGAYFQIVTYLTTRYAGLKNFGKIFGLMAALMAIGTGIGPVLAGHVFDVTASYRSWLFVAIGFSLVAGVLIFRLGPYPDWEADR